MDQVSSISYELTRTTTSVTVVDVVVYQGPISDKDGWDRR